MTAKFVAYFAADDQTKAFKTFHDAKKWLLGRYSVGDEYPQETIDGEDYIAEITHRSVYKITHYQETWDEIAEGGVWPSEHDNMGSVDLKRID